MHWLSSLSWNEVLWMLVGMIVLDGPRYCVTTTLIVLYDWITDAYRALIGKPDPAEFTHCPSVCAMIVGMNEGESLPATLQSLLGTYPRLEVVICDDGSNDEMSNVGRAWAKQHPEIPTTVVQRPWRGGKSSALNMAYQHTNAEIIVAVDGDSHLEPDAIWEIVQPFADPNIGVVSAMVRVRNAFTNFCTWFQAFEYLQAILVGRRVSALLGILPLASGALAAYRRDLLQRVAGWDVGPGEDLDICMKIRKLGFQIAFAPYSTCQTEAPTKWWALLKQRHRWDGDSSVRHFIRKHGDYTNPLWKSFTWSNLLVFWDAVLFHLMCGIATVLWLFAECLHPSNVPYGFMLFTIYVCAVFCEYPTFIGILYYSRFRKTDAVLGLILPLMPLYRFLMLIVRTQANVREILYRDSFNQRHVPPHVRAATWHW